MKNKSHRCYKNKEILQEEEKLTRKEVEINLLKYQLLISMMQGNQLIKCEILLKKAKEANLNKKFFNTRILKIK